jgi:hypothetical protein
MRKNTAMMSHDKSEYDFGFVTVKLMKYLGLVKATAKGADIPKNVQLTSLNFSWVSVFSRLPSIRFAVSQRGSRRRLAVNPRPRYNSALPAHCDLQPHPAASSSRRPKSP